MIRRGLVLVGWLLVLVGALLAQGPIQHSVDVATQRIYPERGHLYAIDRVPGSWFWHADGDDNAHPRRSPLRLFENGRELGPAHSVHDEIRIRGGGRYSHWERSLFFSTSDNSDPRTNGRSYRVSVIVPTPEWLAWACVLLGVLSIARWDRHAWSLAVTTLWSAIRVASRTGGRFLTAGWSPWIVALFVGMVITGVVLGVERSGWILMTQPVEYSHAANSMLGYSVITDQGLLHLENLSSFAQLAFFSGGEAHPDLYFRRPVYTFIASLPAALFGAHAALLALNVFGWFLAVCICHRLSLDMHGDPCAARWSMALAAVGLGYCIHLLDLSAHLLAFVFYIGGVALVWRSRVWREAAPLRVHFALGLYLAVACLQYNTGIALLAAYLLVSFRYNRLAHMALAASLALGATFAWEGIVALVLRDRGLPPANISATEREYFANALAWWIQISHEPAAQIGRRVSTWLGEFATFDSPLVVLVGFAGLAWDARTIEGRRRVLFAAPFLLMPLAAAFVFAPAATARGYLIYGVSGLLCVSCGAVLAGARRGNRALYSAAAIALLVFTVAWSTAHFVNVLGPVKAYFLGADHAQQLFRYDGWSVRSLTGAEPTPALFGGSARLAEAGLDNGLAAYALGGEGRVKYAWMAYALFTALLAVALLSVTALPWRAVVVVVAFMAAIAAVNAALAKVRIRYAVPNQLIPVQPSHPLTITIELAADSVEAFARAVEMGARPTLFPAFAQSPEKPRVRLGGRDIRVGEKLRDAVWALDIDDVRQAVARGGRSTLEVSFQPSQTLWLGGWQATGLPGRRAVYAGGVPPPKAFPAIELRALRDLESMTPVWVGF